MVRYFPFCAFKMKKFLHSILYIALVFLIFEKCSIEKRLYRKGFYIDGLSKKHYTDKEKSLASKQNRLLNPLNPFFSQNTSYSKNSENTDVIALSEKNNLIRIKTHASKKHFQNDSCGDKLILKTGDEFLVKILEVSDEQIKYKRCDNINGPVYSISTSKVYMIEYANGVKEHVIGNAANNNNNDTQNKSKPIENNGKKKYPPEYTTGWILFGVSFLYFTLFAGLAPYALMFMARKGKRKIKEYPQLYKGIGGLNFLMYYSLIITSLIGLFFFILGVIIISNPTFWGVNYMVVGMFLIAIGFVLLTPDLIFLFTSRKEDFQ